MPRPDELLKCIFAARKAATANWDNNPNPNGFALKDNGTSFAAELRRALDSGELTLYYQPKINLASGVISGVEALVRWNHPKYGLIYPSAFIPAAELSGLVVPLNVWVLEEACRQMRLWRQNGIKIMGVSVNVSSAYFKMPEFVGNTQSVLEKYGIEPAFFGIELSEAAAIEDIGKIWGVLSDLLKIGVTISIDDVGTDYVSVSQLCNAPINIIKIDNNFIYRLPHNENAAAFVRNILDIAATSNITTLAEGVETKEQFCFLQEFGCDLAQGYLLCPPLPANRFETFWKVYNRKTKTACTNQTTRTPDANLQPAPDQNMEKTLKANLNHEKIINTIHAIILSNKETAVAINKALRLLGQYFDTENAYLAETDADLKNCSITCEWVRPDEEPLAAALEKVIAGTPDYYELFRAGVFCVNDTAKLPEPLASGYAAANCRSFFQAIIFVRGAIAGHIGFSKKTGNIWSDQEINILKSTANIFSAALTRVRAEREITEHYKQLEVVLEHIDALIAVVDAESCEILFANKNFKQKFPPRKIKNSSQSNPRETGIYLLDKKLALGETLTAEKYNESLAAWLKITSTGITWLDNKPAILQSAVDITTQKKQELLVTEMAYEDILTGLANRRAMEDYLGEKFAQFQKNFEPTFIAMIDIDDFKVVNDVNGHDAGDAILKATASLLKTSVRTNDKVCRWGGEEFVICFGCITAPKVMQIADQLREMIAENYVTFGGQKLSITVSIGLAEFKSGDTHYSKALYDADKALYKSKSLGKNQVSCIDFDTEER